LEGVEEEEKEEDEEEEEEEVSGGSVVDKAATSGRLDGYGCPDGVG
jgi:hypothetical protein